VFASTLLAPFRFARNELVDLEELPDDELKGLEEEFQRLRKKKAGHNGTPSHQEQWTKSR
jgi:hypothetical protein